MRSNEMTEDEIALMMSHVDNEEVTRRKPGFERSESVGSKRLGKVLAGAPSGDLGSYGGHTDAQDRKWGDRRMVAGGNNLCRTYISPCLDDPYESLKRWLY